MKAPGNTDASKQFEGSIIRGYRVTRLLGRGGMGAVYEADAVEGSREKRLRGFDKVAIKVLAERLSTDKTAVKRFMHEARATMRVDHPGLVKMLAYGQTEDGWPYIMMEYLAGESLKDRLKSKGSLSIAATLRIVRDVAMALIAAHTKGVVHRDLKPDNLMLLPNPNSSVADRVKVLDFGIAKIVVATGQETVPGFKTATGAILGTPAYMSPEMCRGCGPSITERADVYSLGIILYELIIGKRPFVGKAFGELLVLHIMEPPPSLRAERPDAPIALDRLINRMLAKQPKERPAMVEVVHVLNDLVEGQMTIAVGRENALTHKMDWVSSVLPSLSRLIVKRYWPVATLFLLGLILVIFGVKLLVSNPNVSHRAIAPAGMPMGDGEPVSQPPVTPASSVSSAHVDPTKGITTKNTPDLRRKPSIGKAKPIPKKPNSTRPGGSDDIGLKAAF